MNIKHLFTKRKNNGLIKIAVIEKTAIFWHVSMHLRK